MRQEQQHNAAAVKRRYRDQVEHAKADVHADQNIKEIQHQLGRRAAAGIIYHFIEQHGRIGQQKVGERPRRGGNSHPPFGIFEARGVDANRLCPPDPGRNHAQSAQRVKVAQRIHGQAAHILGGGIAQFPADKRVGGFMERDDDQHGHGAQSVIIQLLRGDHAIEGKMIHKNLSIPHSRPHRHIRVII